MTSTTLINKCITLNNIYVQQIIKGVEKKMSPFEIHTLTQSIFNLQILFKYE